MSLEFTVDGLEIQSFEDIFDALVVAYKGIYGADIDLAQNTPDGQKVGIEAELEHDLQTFALALYNSWDPDLSAGESLNKIIKICGITRNPSTRSSVEVTITTDRIIALDAGYTVADGNGQNWITDADASLVSGANTVTLIAEDWGKVEATAGTVTEPVTIILGIVSVTNAADAIAGVDEETDTALRIRRNKSLENPSYSTVGGLFAKLANLDGVTDLAVYENETDIYDATLALDAHTIWCIIQGGVVADIAETISKNKTAGTGLKGSSSTTYVETILKPDGTSFIFTHTVLYDRPTDVPLYVELTVTRKDPAEAIDIDGIKEKLAEKTYGINENAQANELYASVYESGTNFIATNLQISLDDITYTDEQAASDYDEILLIETANITVTEV